MNIYLGADHRGFHLKEQIEAFLKQIGHSVIDEGGQTLDPNDDYTVFATKVVAAMLSSDDKEPRGILVCGSGQGMVMAANRHRGVRAGLGWSVDAARATRNDEDSNVLALPADVLENGETWKDIVKAWIDTPFAGADRYKRRIRQLDEL